MTKTAPKSNFPDIFGKLRLVTRLGIANRGGPIGNLKKLPIVKGVSTAIRISVYFKLSHWLKMSPACHVPKIPAVDLTARGVAGRSRGSSSGEQQFQPIIEYRKEI
jgi:hypothetical protein